MGKPREVILSRWCKIKRVVPDSEVADSIAETLRSTDIAVPVNVVTPSLLNELEKQGVAIERGGDFGNPREATLMLIFRRVEMRCRRWFARS